MSDMTTFAGQAEHYAGVRMRLRLQAFQVIRKPVQPIRIPVCVEVSRDTGEPLPVQYVPVNLINIPSWKIIVKLVALKHGVSFDEIIGPSRFKEIVLARHEAMRLVRQHTDISAKRIGLLFGGRDHTSVLYALGRRGPKGVIHNVPTIHR